MKKGVFMKLKLAIAALAATLSMSSFAGFMIEPYAGFGTYATTLDAAAFEDAEASGETYTSVGARAGYSLLLFSGGLDLEMMATGDGNINNTAFWVGVDLPVLLRFYGKYIFSSSFDYDNDDASSVDLEFDSGYAVGVGFTGLPFVVINLEVSALNYTFENPLNTSQDVDFGVAATALTVSLPLP